MSAETVSYDKCPRCGTGLRNIGRTVLMYEAHDTDDCIRALRNDLRALWVWVKAHGAHHDASRAERENW